MITYNLLRRLPGNLILKANFLISNEKISDFSDFVSLFSFTAQLEATQLEEKLGSASHRGPSSSTRFWQGGLKPQMCGRQQGHITNVFSSCSW